MFESSEYDFSTDSIEEFREFLSKNDHHVTGVAPCNLCGQSTEFDYRGKQGKRPPAICKDCRKKIAAEQKGGN